MKINTKVWVWIEFALVICCMALPMMLINIHLKETPLAFCAFAISALIALPFIFISSRMRPLSLIPVWLVAIFYVINMWYWRIFQDFIPIQNYFLVGNFTSDLWSAGFNQAKPIDFALVFPAVCLSLFYALKLNRYSGSKGFSFRCRIIVGAIVTVCFAVSELIYVNICGGGGFTSSRQR